MSNQSPESTLTPLQKVGTVVVDSTPGEVKRAFFLFGGTNTYIMRNGVKVLFKMGAVPKVAKPAFVTTIKGYIDELDEQIKLGHESLHIEPGYESVTDDMLDPLADVKKQAVLDYLNSDEYKAMIANIKGVGTPANSVSQQDTKFTGANSANVAPVTAEADGNPTVTPAAAPLNLASLGK